MNSEVKQTTEIDTKTLVGLPNKKNAYVVVEAGLRYLVGNISSYFYFNWRTTSRISQADEKKLLLKKFPHYRSFVKFSGRLISGSSFHCFENARYFAGVTGQKPNALHLANHLLISTKEARELIHLINQCRSKCICNNGVYYKNKDYSKRLLCPICEGRQDMLWESMLKRRIKELECIWEVQANNLINVLFQLEKSDKVL